jgi:hypothetical protein
MKKLSLFLLPAIAGLFFVAANKHSSSKGFKTGTPEIKSISSLAFGPKGVLFIGDSKSATVFAVNTNETRKNIKAGNIDIKDIDQKIAAALGTETANIAITDMAVNPDSKIIYLSVQHTDGTPVLVKIDGDKISAFPLKDVVYSSVVLNNSPAEDEKDQRGRPLRISTISDMGFADGKLLVSGLSNHQFRSSFKSIPYPFGDQQEESTLEIYHTAHGRYETEAPIRTFTTTEINGKKYLLASYTCTPLVLFPLGELKPGMHVKGRTVAEMGSGNTPIDMLSMHKGNESYLLMANTARAVSKVDYKNIASFEGALTEPVKGTAGVNFTLMPEMTKVLQMDKLNENQLLVLQKKANGEVDLRTVDENSL